MSESVAATKKKRGRPTVFESYGGEDAERYKNKIDYIWGDTSKRGKANGFYTYVGLCIASDCLSKDDMSKYFHYGMERHEYNGGRIHAQGILEQIGRMNVQNNYSWEDCQGILKVALVFRDDGATVRTVESYIRHGRTTGEW